MSMTKKDFTVVAEAISRANHGWNFLNEAYAADGIIAVLEELVSAFTNEYPNFNAEKFVEVAMKPPRPQNAP